MKYLDGDMYLCGKSRSEEQETVSFMCALHLESLFKR